MMLYYCMWQPEGRVTLAPPIRQCHRKLAVSHPTTPPPSSCPAVPAGACVGRPLYMCCQLAYASYLTRKLLLQWLCCAGRASTSVAAATSRIIPDSHVDQYSRFDPLPPQYSRRRQRTCHSFNADTALGRTSEVYDVNGIVSLLCRCVQVVYSLYWCCVSTL